MNIIFQNNGPFPEGITYEQTVKAAALGAEKIGTVYETNRDSKIVAKIGKAGFTIRGRFLKGLNPEFTITGISPATPEEMALKNNAKNPNPAIVRIGK